ncbi:GTPase activating protein [Malassezia cuniculi]|uniref:GTPase activating protein n=1 Tax=Malassezia cuniculi TaxID=948313 RepID=A0AAF0J762_9BASI|nr:GTPase activating protein [Malassezia cuniculi]
MPVIWRDSTCVHSMHGVLEVVARTRDGRTEHTIRFAPEQENDGFFEIPLKDVASFRAFPPSPTRRDGHVDIYTLRESHTVYFPKKWSGRAFIAAVGTLVEVRQEPSDSCLYTITPEFADDALDRPGQRAVSLRDIRFNVLSSFSHVTRGARVSRDALLRNPLVRRTVAPNANTKTTSTQAGPHMLDGRPPGRPEEYDSSRVRLARWAHTVAGHAERERQGYQGPPPPSPVSLAEWRELATLPPHEMAKQVFEKGLSAEARPEAWPMLINSRRTTQSDVADDYFAMRDGWLSSTDVMAESETALSARRIWIDCLRADTKDAVFAVPVPEARERMLRSAWRRGPAEGDSRGDVNSHLFVISEILLTYVLHESRGGGALQGYVQGMSDLCTVAYVACQGDETKTFQVFCGIMDRIHPHYALDQQGMRESLVLLERLMAELCPALHRHLEEHEALNMFFCFRWLLVYFKREFALDDVQRLWDSIWASEYGGGIDVSWPFCRRFELFVALAILESHEGPIVRHLKSFDEVLEYVHELSGNLDVHAVLRRASALVYRLRSRMHSEPPPAASLLELVEY